MPSSMPKPSGETRALFESVLPQDPRIKARPMFGNVAGFLNGNMFMGLFGDELFVRLSEDDRAELLREDGTSVMEPRPGRPMKEYVFVPHDWHDDPSKMDEWVARSMAYVGDMPEKKPKSKRSRASS